MKAKISLLLGTIIVFFSFGTAWSTGSSRVKVFVDCGAEDIVGTRVCSQLKEKIRGSNGFELVQAVNKFVFCVHLLSVDIDQGKGSAVSRIYSLGTDQNSAAYIRQILKLPPDPSLESKYPEHSELLLAWTMSTFSTVSTFSAVHVADTADAIFADIDKNSGFLRK
ncbi:MAG: hypothetical protein Q7S58_21755 [Candidatus Binatus sp.]|uniref:hypothetical protein n=1 Tax=Candidatus Binatus sp. TaxID=2811406 RepID=UPI002725BFB2|nr:hypothetical protein [Candidatus Binatus sp.]MDO8435033.1 hypothetical protein [Candidatus Binatus sp.]